MSSRDLTIVQRILLAAHEISGEGRSFSAEDLVVRCWELYPDHFGLQGYAQKYPDSNRVLTKIMGAKGGLRGRGWITKTGSKRYRLTEVGAIRAKELKGDAVGSETGRFANLHRSLVAALRRMLDSSARTKFESGQRLTFSDACGFWNISSRSTATQFTAKTEEADLALRLGLEEAKDHGGRLTLPGATTGIATRDIEGLSALSEHLREEFADEISVIGKRTDERKL